MEGEGTYLKRESYSSAPSNSYASYTTTTPLQKSQYRYSSPVQEHLNTIPRISRRYATPEESDAMFPVFDTPTNMYLKKELNSQQRYAPTTPQQQQPLHNTSSPRYHQSRPSYNSSSFDPLSGKVSPASTPTYQHERQEPSPTTRPNTANNFYINKQDNRNNHTSTPSGTSSFSSASSASSTKDMLLAQLVDMGFDLEASRVAITASGSTNLQDVLDILVQNEKAENGAANYAQESSSDEEDLQAEKQSQDIWQKQQEERRREYLEQLKRNNPIPTKPKFSTDTSYSGQNGTSFNNTTSSPSSSHVPSPRPFPSVSSKSPPVPPPHDLPRTPQHPSPPASTSSTVNTPPPRTQSYQPDPVTSYADKERKQGNYCFNNGQFAESESAYTLAINALPAGHGDIVLLSNNRAAARLKQSKYQECLSDCSTAIDIARKHMQNNTPISPIMNATSSNMKAQLIKALHRKATALEGLQLFEAAIQMYEEYVRLDGTRSAKVTQDIMRCQQALLDSKKQQQQWKPATSADDTTTAFPDIDFNMFIPKADPKIQSQLKEINSSKAVKEMREREKKKEEEEAERLKNEDKVNAQISVWKTGKDKNLRALLGSLELILWPDIQWKGVMMTDLLDVRKCKVTYMKAIAKVHPDKLPANATVEQRMLASGIFTTLNQAWDVFKTENNL